MKHLSRSALRLLAALMLAAAAVTLTTPAHAAAQSGWIRLAHLSPDTPAVNVSLTSVDDSSTRVKLSDVGYGDVSGYQKVPVGRYVASMTPAGGGRNATAVISQAVTVADGRAYTVAAVGPNAELRGTVLDDDLRTPKAGSARVRLLQAAVSAPTATVTAVGGPVLAQDATFGSTTGYATIEAGVWTVQITPAGGSAAPITTKITATPGSVNTIIVLDQSGGGLKAVVIKDAAATPSMPKKGKGVETGGGGTATDVLVPSAGAGRSVGAATLIAALAGLAPVGLVAGWLLRRRTGRPTVGA